MEQPGGTQPETPGPRRMRLTGIHHLTLIGRDLGRTTAFYRDLLGLALVREGRNADDPTARSCTFGDEHGAPGTLVTFLEYPRMPQGVVGYGSTHHFAFGVGSSEELVAWRDYLRTNGVQCTDVFARDGLESLYLRDPDGHIVEITTAAATAAGAVLSKD